MFPTQVVEKYKTHILSSNDYFSEYRAVDELMWKNILVPNGPQIRT